MFKRLILLFIVTLAISTFAMFSNSLSALNYGESLAEATPTPTKQAIIKSVTLDKNEAVLWCPSNEAMKPVEGEIGCTEEGSQIKISTELTNNDESLEFYYIVSSGEIVGTGKNVIWRFTNSKLGRHKLMVGVGKKDIILSELVTKTVQLSDCSVCDPPPCACPDLILNPPPKEVKVGDIIVLSFENGEPEPNRTFANWKIENGEIINGQGTKKVLVKVSKKPQKNILKVAVETSTECEACIRAVEEKIKIIK